MNKVVKFGSAAMLISLLSCGQATVAQTNTVKTVKDGVFTEAQVKSGQTVYDSSCKTCHDMRFYRDTLRSWNNQPLLYLWETVMGTMPADNPGSLMFEEYTDVLAYILSEQGFPAGESTLDPDNGMDSINIVSP